MVGFLVLFMRARSPRLPMGFFFRCGGFDCQVCTPATPKHEEFKVRTLIVNFAGLPRPNLKLQGNDFNPRAVFVRHCACHRSMRQPQVQFKQHGLLLEHCACHKSKKGAVISFEHLCLPYVHLKKCMGCFSKMCLPQVHKKCRGFC